MLARLTMLPLPWSIIGPRACLATRKVPVRLMSITRCHSSRSSRWTGPPPATPAALTTESSRPWARRRWRRPRSATAVSSVMSTAWSTSPVDVEGRRTVAPSSRKRVTQASPMPEAAPVTSATVLPVVACSPPERCSCWSPPDRDPLDTVLQRSTVCNVVTVKRGPPEAPTSGRPVDTREQILRAAEACIRRWGIRRFSMNDVARGAGVSRMSVYRHFADRDALVLAVLERLADQTVAGLDPGHPAAPVAGRPDRRGRRVRPPPRRRAGPGPGGPTGRGGAGRAPVGPRAARCSTVGSSSGCRCWREAQRAG